MIKNQVINKSTSTLVVLLLLAINPGAASADPIKPFVSDGCSAFPDGTLRHKALWLSCCRQHDHDYWKGGTHQQRLASDNALEACVSKVGEPEIAKLMLLGVRVGGSPYLPTEFRWGYGWPFPRLYGALSEAELKQIKALDATDKNAELP